MDQISAENEAPTQLVGHAPILEQMLSSASEDRLHHGWVLSGAKGIGKARLAIEVAAELLATSNENASLFGDGAGTDTQSQIDRNLVHQHTHPDFLYISADTTESNKSGLIKVEQIRKVNHFMANSSARGGWRVVIIDSMDEVNVNGANALLKILEEPPEKTLLLLLSSAKGRLMPTIRSRCRMQTVHPLSAEDTIGVLQQIYTEADADFLRNLATLSSGAPGRALALAEAGAIDAYEQTCQILAHHRHELAEVMRLANLWGDGGVKAAPKRLAGQYLFDRLFAAAAVAGVAKADMSGFLPYEIEAIQSLTTSFSSDILADMHQDVGRIFHDSRQFYLDATAVFQPFLLKIHGKN